MAARCAATCCVSSTAAHERPLPRAARDIGTEMRVAWFARAAGRAQRLASGARTNSCSERSEGDLQSESIEFLSRFKLARNAANEELQSRLFSATATVTTLQSSMWEIAL
jgi:hypothetical protein